MLYILFIIASYSISFVRSLPLFWVGGVTSNSAKLCLQVKIPQSLFIYMYKIK